MLSTAFSPLWDILAALRAGLLPTLSILMFNPFLLLQPKKLSQVFFSKVWVPFGDGVDEGGAEVKEDLIRSRAHGVICDIGAGHGHLLRYLDIPRITRYIALEPNENMHPFILAEARKVGLRSDQIQILPYGIDEMSPSTLAPHIPPNSITTLISILTLCSIPSPHTTLPPFLSSFLAPGSEGGRFLFYEHVLSETREDVRWWQRVWSPVWSWFFDGCRLDCDTVRVVRGCGGWKVGKDGVIGEIGGKKGEEAGESLFGHVVGCFERE